MKRILALVLCVLLLAALLVGCGGNSGNSGNSGYSGSGNVPAPAAGDAGIGTAIAVLMFAGTVLLLRKKH